MAEEQTFISIVVSDCSWPEALIATCYRKAAVGGLLLAREEAANRKASRILIGYISVFSEISSASSTSIPKYRTVLSNFVWPSNSCTARRFLVRR